VISTITQFRKDLFQLADKALQGETVAFTYRGVVFRVLPEKRELKLNQLIGQPVVAEGIDLERASKELSAAMEEEWLRDWSEV
jgi:hypothetical protein